MDYGVTSDPNLDGYGRCATKRTGVCAGTHGAGAGRPVLKCAHDWSSLMSPLSTSDAYDRVVALIASHNGSRIPVPELARLLRVKATTLNARLRRTLVPVRDR